MKASRVAAVLFFLIVIVSQFTLLGQKAEDIDSLKRELATSPPDTTQIHILLDISMKYHSFETDSSMYYATASLKKSEEIEYTKGRADALLQIGRLKRDLDNATDALTDMFVALKLYREINDRVQIANSLNDISIIYATSGDFEKSLSYFEQALEIFQQMGDTKGESYALNNIGEIYQELKDETKAKEYFIRSLRLKEKNNDLYGISRGYFNLGMIAENNGQWDEALEYYHQADAMYDKTNDLQAQAHNLVAIGRVEDARGRTGEAVRYAARALEKSKMIKSLSSMSKASLLLAALEEKRHNYKRSLEYQKLYNQIADSLSNESLRANLEELKAKFDFGEKEREIALLKKDKELQQAEVERKNILTYGLTATILLVTAVLGLLYYTYRATKSKRDSLALKNKEIEQQRNDLDKLNKEKDRFFSILSHDLRSPLNALKGLSYLLTAHLNILTQTEINEIRTKIDTSLDNLTNLINNILEWSMASQKRKGTLDKIDAEELIQKNILLYKNIAESKGVTIDHTPQGGIFGYADYHAVDTVIRNLLSNSIKFSHPNKRVTISASNGGDTVFISVKDQGIGIPLDVQNTLFTFNGHTSQLGTNNEKGTGLGLTLCMELMKENKGNITVKSKPGEGSEFIISLPVSNEHGNHLQ